MAQYCERFVNGSISAPVFLCQDITDKTCYQGRNNLTFIRFRNNTYSTFHKKEMLNADSIQILRLDEIHTRKIPHEIEIIVERCLNVIDHVTVE